MLRLNWVWWPFVKRFWFFIFRFGLLFIFTYSLLFWINFLFGCFSIKWEIVWFWTWILYMSVIFTFVFKNHTIWQQNLLFKLITGQTLFLIFVFHFAQTCGIFLHIFKAINIMTCTHIISILHSHALEIICFWLLGLLLTKRFFPCNGFFDYFTSWFTNHIACKTFVHFSNNLLMNTGTCAIVNFNLLRSRNMKHLIQKCQLLCRIWPFLYLT